MYHSGLCVLWAFFLVWTAVIERGRVALEAFGCGKRWGGGDGSGCLWYRGRGEDGLTWVPMRAPRTWLYL